MAFTPTDTGISSTRPKVYSVLIGLTSLVILLQGVWAGLFVREGADNDSSWVSVHARGADLAILLAVLAIVVLFVRHRDRRDLMTGTIALLLLLVLESYMGGLIGDHPGAEAVHFPLAMGLVGLSVWLPWRSRAQRSGGVSE